MLSDRYINNRTLMLPLCLLTDNRLTIPHTHTREGEGYVLQESRQLHKQIYLYLAGAMHPSNNTARYIDDEVCAVEDCLIILANSNRCNKQYSTLYVLV